MKYAMKESIRHGTPEVNFAIYDHPLPAPGASFNAHWHQEIEIEYVYSGSVDFLLDGVRYTVQSGDILFINKNVIHACEAPAACSGRYVSIVFGEQFVFSNYGDALYNTYLASIYEKGMCFPTRLKPDAPCRQEIISHIRALLDCYFEKKFACEISIRSHFLAIYYTALEQRIFVREIRRENAATQMVRSAMLLIQQHYTSSLSVQSIAAELGITPQYLCRIFKASVGKTPMEFILSCRVEHAQFLLTQSDMTIADAALTSGFDDFNYFSRFFKKVHGITPSAYRARYRNPEAASASEKQS